jgi:hypothetical protein
MNDGASFLDTIQNGVTGVSAQFQPFPSPQNLQVWITENNLSYIFNNPNGTSSCDGTTPFVVDPRAGTAFFAAWRSYFFPQVAKAGVQSLHHS